MNSRAVESGTITRRGDDSLHEYRLEWLCPRHLPAMVGLQSLVVRTMSDREFLAVSTPHILRRNLSDRVGLTLGAFVGNMLIGYASMHFLSEYRWREQSDIPFEDAAILDSGRLADAALYKQALIHPEFRGNSLLKNMAAQLKREAMKRRSGLTYFFAVAHPCNYPSLRQLFSHDLLAISLIRNRNDWVRLIFREKLAAKPRAADFPAELVACHDFQRQQEYLGKGFWGSDVSLEESGPFIHFRKYDLIPD